MRVELTRGDKGLDKFNRFSFEIKVALGIFQQIIDTILSYLNFAIAYLEYILIKSDTPEQHIQLVIKVLRKTNEYGFKLIDEKWEYFITEIKYLGQIKNR